MEFPKKFRFHLLSLAHIPTTKEYSACAYSQKIIKLSTMLMKLGHDVYFYGNEDSELPCTELVPVLTKKERDDCYGPYDWKKEFFKFSNTDSVWTTFNNRSIVEINKRKEKFDFLLCTMGHWHRPVADAVKDITVVEPGIGYSGVFSSFRVFESYAWMHYIYGQLKQETGNFYDCVIPNFYDPMDFPYSEKKEDYFVYMGRLIYNKGVDIAVQTTKKIGAKLIVAGQGSLTDGGLNIKDSHVEHVGCLGMKEKGELLSKAKGLFVPTYYIEPFGGVSIESFFAGTPVISTDWGCFSENNIHGKTGYRCRTLGEFIWAAKNIENIKSYDCRHWAVNNFSMDRIAQQYQHYFENIRDLDINLGAGFYSDRVGNMNHLTKYF
ncbi:MAG: glycosyltransferase [Nanoarchaeota archaeon]